MSGEAVLLQSLTTKLPKLLLLQRDEDIFPGLKESMGCTVSLEVVPGSCSICKNNLKI
jgi:hypothetical protein